MPIAILQAEIENLQAQLESLRADVVQHRVGILERIESLKEQAESVRDRAADTDYEPSARVIVDLLDTVYRNLALQQRVNATRAAA